MNKKQRVFQIIGQPGAGKTTLVAELVRELFRSGVAVGTIKHSTHSHELDKPGKDSFRHKEAGAASVTMMTKHWAAVYLPRKGGMTPNTILNQFYSHLDVVLIEGWISGPYPKIEIWREAVGRRPLFETVSGVRAVAIDGPRPQEIRESAQDNGLAVFPRKETGALIEFILSV